MFRNLSTNAISLIFATFVVVVGLCTVWISTQEIIWPTSLFIFLSIIGLISYLSAKWLLHKYVHRRIRSIYKIISSVKEGNNVNLDLESKSLEEVDDEVLEWAEVAKKELSDLKLLEEYRKDFVGNVSHELKTPIFSIQGYLHTILEGAMYDEKVFQKYLERALVNVDRLQNIVEDLEVINKIEEDKMILDVQRLNLHSLVAEVIEDINVQFEDDPGKTVLLNKINPSIHVFADSEAINQVLTNLIVNSIKYGRENGNTTIGTDDIADKVLVEVSDDGIGIAPEHLKHLFDRFYRVDSSRARKLGGSGLGLSIVKHLVESHGETVNVRSTPGTGSTFSFTLKKAK